MKTLKKIIFTMLLVPILFVFLFVNIPLLILISICVKICGLDQEPKGTFWNSY